MEIGKGFHGDNGGRNGTVMVVDGAFPFYYGTPKKAS